VAAPAVAPWQKQLNELGGVKPLAFGQRGELRHVHCQASQCRDITRDCGAQATASGLSRRATTRGRAAAARFFGAILFWLTTSRQKIKK
jgi:hypothetical protein